MGKNKEERKTPKLNEVVEVKHIDGVTYQRKRISCGKCTRCLVFKEGHLYWYAYWSEGGKTRSEYIGKEFRKAKRQMNLDFKSKKKEQKNS